MPSIQHIQQANRSLQSASEPKTALFVGATSGIGLGAIEALLRSLPGSTLFIIGRSESTFATTLSRLRNLDPKASITFLEAQVSLLNDVSRVCDTVSQQSQRLDILWLSQGGLGLRETHGRTREGLPTDSAVSTYGRLLFMHRLAPLLSRSSSRASGRVVSVLCAGLEGPVHAADPGLLDDANYAAAGFWAAQKQGITVQSLAMRRLAREHAGVSFVHANPGMVTTDVHAKWAASFTGVWRPVAWLIEFVMAPLARLVGWTAAQAGEIGLYEATDLAFAAGGGGGGGEGRNFFRVDERADVIQKGGRELLDRLSADGSEGEVWAHVVGVWERVLSG